MTNPVPWQDLLQQDPELPSELKLKLHKFIEHFLLAAISHKGDEPLNLQEFIDISCLKYRPTPQHLETWQEAAKWYSAYGCQHYRILLIHTLRRQHYAYKTEKAYLGWADRFMKFHDLPKNPLSSLVTQFLDHLSIHEGVAPNTQKQALNAIVFLYRDLQSQSRP